MNLRGGTKFKAAINGVIAQLTKPGLLRVGFLEGATYPDGTSVAAVAAFNEFGRTVSAKNEEGEMQQSYFQLPRPFFRNMIAAKASSWPGAIAKNLKATGYDTEATLRLAGDGIKGQLQQSIQDTNDPPLAESTIAAKGFDKPLIDTGHMFNSVDFEVKT